jgi:integrase
VRDDVGLLAMEPSTNACDPSVGHYGVGELLALRWGALDLDIGTLTVRESVYEGQHQGPKRERARRTIPVGSHAVAAQRGRTPKHDAEDLVFANRKGLPFRESKLFTRVLQPAAEAAGLGRVTWHQYSHSSLLNDLKVPAKIAQEQLGHDSISTTLGIYTHVVDASHRSAVEAVEDRLLVNRTQTDATSPTRRTRQSR